MTRVACIAVDLINADKPPASLAFLAGVCEQVGVDYTCVSINAEMLRNLSKTKYNNLYNKVKLDDLDSMLDVIDPHFDRIVNEIADYRPDLVLISLFSYMQYAMAEYLLTKLRVRCPDVTIQAGGPGISTQAVGQTNGKKLLTKGLIDYYVLGEGDEIVPKFIRGERDMIGLNSQDNPFESWVPQITDLDSAYIVPSYKKLDLSVYHNLEAKDNVVLSITTSRGCVRDCAFCDVGKSWPKFRFRSGLLVADEILDHHQTIGAVNFYIVDSLINGSLKSFNEFNQAMIKLKEQYPSLQDFSYNGMFIVRDRKTHTEEFFRTMAEAGCESLAIGVETGSDRLRYDMNKKFTNKDLDHHLEMCQKYGIKNTFLMFTGYPTETDEDFAATLRMLKRYQKYLIDNTILGINFTGIFSLLPDTPVFDHRDQIGIEIIEHQDGGLNKINWINRNNPDLTVKKRIQRDLAFRRLAAELRYPIPYSDRYLEYLQQLDRDFLPVSD